jgi:Na+/H+ antiporter NhaD/arsenite permease-like protein
MLITNDVALITFVPFTIILFSDSNSRTQLPYVITIETIAANLGSMLTPIGNPQSLYIYSLSNMTLTGFISTMLPYSILSLMLIMLSLLSIKAYPVNSSAETGSLVNQGFGIKLTVYILLFAVCMLNVLHILSYYAVLIITVTVIFITDRALFKSVDYILLLTFAFFFIFIGNIGRIPAVNGLLSSAIVGREALSGILCSQFMSNVPATILLSGFTVNYGSLLIGVNIGGLGTMIASMASLISYRQYKQTNIKSSHSYMFIFSIYNIIFLIALVCLYLFI